MYKIIIDSCGELTEELKADGHYASVPLEMEVNGHRIVDDATFDQQDFLKKVKESPVGPKSSCPSPERYMEAFQGECLIGTWGIMLALLSQLLAAPLSKLFVGYDAELFAMTEHGFRIYCLAYLINGFNIFGSSFFTALNNGVISAVISFLRTLVFQIIMILLLPTLLGINGIWSAVGIAELMTLCVTITFFIKQRKKYHYV